MDVTPLIRRDAKIIQSYKDGIFKVSGEIFTHSITVFAERVQLWPHKQCDIASLTADAFAVLKDTNIEVLLFGTGTTQTLLSPALRQQVKSMYGFTVEPMDNGAASRTYNVLMAEGRRVAVVLSA